jgi:hypothetical protein
LAGHLAYATVRMELQCMIMVHAAGLIAAVSILNSSSIVQNVDIDYLHEVLVIDDQLLSLKSQGLDTDVALSMA